MSQRLNYNAASPAGMKALGAVYAYVRQSGLPSRLVDLVFLRVSNNPPFRIGSLLHQRIRRYCRYHRAMDLAPLTVDLWSSIRMDWNDAGG